MADSTGDRPLPENTRLQRSLRATFIGLAVNVVLTAVKFTAGVLGRSHALIADGVESTADIVSSLIVWRGVVVASEPADRDHPYGHGKAEPLAAAVVSIVLLLGAGGIIVKSILQLAHPRERPAAFTLVALLGVVAVKEVLFRFVVKEADSIESIVVRTDAWHHRSDAITSLAAAIGISVTLVGGPSFAFADDAAAILAGCVIAWNGWRMFRPAADELMDAEPGSAMLAKVREAAAKVEGVNAVEKCMVRKMGGQYFVDMHVEVDPNMTVQEGHRIAHSVKDKVRETVPQVYDVLVHVEPSKSEPRGAGDVSI